MLYLRLVIFIACALFFFRLDAQSISELQKAEKYFQLRDFDNAYKRFTKVLESNDDKADALWRLGDIHFLRYEYEKALEYYAEASSLVWKSDEHTRRYIETLIQFNKVNEAFRWAINLEGKNEDVGTRLINKIEFIKTHSGDASSYNVTMSEISSKSADYGASFMADDYFVYSSARGDIKRSLQTKGPENWAGQNFNQLFIAPMNLDKSFDRPLFLRGDLEHEYNEGPLGVSPDGEWVALTKNNFLDGMSQIYSPGVEMNLYTGRLDDKGQWKDLQAYEHNVQGYSTGMACFNSDATIMYFASNRPGGVGGFDIYCSKKDNGRWTEPVNMGPVVNSPGNEVTPFFNDNSLFFSSDLHPGFGGLDVYRAEISDFETPNKIYHLGTEVNSPFDDYYFTYNYDTEKGLLSSNRRMGYAEDIYTVEGLGHRMKIKVLDASTGKGLSKAVILFEKCVNDQLITDTDGEASMRIMQDLQCSITITKDGYGSIQIPLNTKARDYLEIALYKNNLEGESTGLVQDVDGQGLDKVYVKATSLKDGYFIESVTESNGTYKIDLSPNAQYRIEYLKSGYQPQYLSLSTSDILESSLPSVQMATVGKDNPTQTYNSTEVSSVVPVKDGFAFQLGAFKDLSSINFLDYSDVADLGELYTVEEKGIHKLRLGTYTSEKTADNVQVMLEERGYSTAFKVYEGENKMKIQKPASKMPNEVPDNRSLEYGVQLGAYSQPQWFDKQTAIQLGILDSIEKDNLTVFVVRDIFDLIKAKEVLKKAKDAGFKDAYLVVLEKDGFVKLRP